MTMKRIDGKVILITGSGRGIGSAIACKCAKEGAEVIVNYLENEKTAQETVDKIKTCGGSAIPIQADVTDNRQCCKLIDEVCKIYNRLDIVVNNAHRPFIPMAFNRLEWNDLMDQFKGTFGNAFFCTKYALPLLRKSKESVILNMSSYTVCRPEVGFISRNIAKAAIEALTRSLAIELASDNIRVNTMSIGWTKTDQLQGYSKEYMSQMKSGIPLGRLATPDEIAETAMFLVSPMSSYMTGTILPVAGGLSPDLR